MLLANPCCKCTDDEQCDYFTDDFNRADANPPGINYTVLAGTVEIAGNKLKFTGSGSVRVDVLSPNLDGRHSAGFSITSFNADTDRVRIDLDYVDANNSHFIDAPVKADAAGPALIKKRTGGVDTLLATGSMRNWGQTTSGPFVAGACLNTVHFSSGVFGGIGAMHAFTSAHGGQYAVISVTTAGVVEIDNLTLSQIRQNSLDVSHGTSGFGTPIDCVRCRVCNYCDATPEELDLVTSGVYAEVPPTFQNAANSSLYDGAFSLDWYGLSATFGGIQTCSWRSALVALNATITNGGVTYTHTGYDIVLDNSEFLLVLNHYRVAAGVITATINSVFWRAADEDFLCEPGGEVEIPQNDQGIGGGGPYGNASATVTYP